MKNKITLANSDAYNAANLSEPLSAYCAGLPIDGGTAELLAFIAPEVKTAKRFEYTKFGDGIMLVDEDDERAVRGEFKEIDISGDVVNAKLVNHGLTLAIDDDEFFADYEQEAVRILKNRLVANELSRAVAMAKAAAGTLESKTWKSGGGTNPDLDIRKLITSVGDICREIFGDFARVEIPFKYSAGTGDRVRPEKSEMIVACDALAEALQNACNAAKSPILEGGTIPPPENASCRASARRRAA